MSTEYEYVGKVDRKTTGTTSALKFKFCNVILGIRGEHQTCCRIPPVRALVHKNSCQNSNSTSRQTKLGGLVHRDGRRTENVSLESR